MRPQTMPAPAGRYRIQYERHAISGRCVSWSVMGPRSARYVVMTLEDDAGRRHPVTITSPDVYGIALLADEPREHGEGPVLPEHHGLSTRHAA